MPRVALGRRGTRKAASSAALALFAASAVLASAGPVSAAARPLHGMGATHSPGAVVRPAAGLRALSTIAEPAISLPATVDLSRYAEQVGDQGSTNSCAAWAIGYSMMGWFARSQGHTGAPFAPMYAYSQVDGGQDEGSSPADVLEVLSTQGIDTAADYALAHSSFDWSHKPTVAERTHAVANKITGWVTLYNTYYAPGSLAVTALKSTLASGRPVALAIAVYNNFMNAYGPGAGSVVSSGGNPGKLLGYHEVLALGYDARGVRIENSWGTGWGDQGYATLDWNYIAEHSFEAETIGGLAVTTGINRPVVTAVSAASADGQVVTVTGTRLDSAMVTMGTTTFAPIAVSGDGRKLTFRVPAGVAATSSLRVSTPGGVSALRTYRFVR